MTIYAMLYEHDGNGYGGGKRNSIVGGDNIGKCDKEVIGMFSFYINADINIISTLTLNYMCFLLIVKRGGQS